MIDEKDISWTSDMSADELRRFRHYMDRMEQIWKTYPNKVALSTLMAYDWVSAFCMMAPNDATAEEALNDFVVRCQMMERRAEKNRKKGNIFEEVEPQ